MTTMNEQNEYITEMLLDVKSNSIRRRITKELTELSSTSDENMLCIESIQYDEKGVLFITIVDYISENINTYEFYIGVNYPFSLPKIKINYADYIDFLRINTIRFQKILKKIKGIHCLCCNSYFCGETWTPVKKLKSIIDEIRIFRKYKIDIIHKFYADKVKDKYLISDINLDSWLF
jgi:hypothetical protein